jgi:hypothetical protein
VLNAACFDFLPALQDPNLSIPTSSLIWTHLSYCAHGFSQFGFPGSHLCLPPPLYTPSLCIYHAEGFPWALRFPKENNTLPPLKDLAGCHGGQLHERSQPREGTALGGKGLRGSLSWSGLPSQRKERVQSGDDCSL